MYSAQDARPPPGYGEEEEGEVQPRYSHQSQQYNHAAGQQQYKYVNDTNEFEHMGQFDHQPHQPHQQYQHHQHHNYAYVQQQQQQQHPHQQHQQYYHPQQQGQHYVADPYYHPHQQQHQQVQYHSPDDPPSLHHDQVHLQDQQHPQSDHFHPKEPLTIGGSPPPAGSRTIFHDKWFIFAFNALFIFMLVLSCIYGPQMTADISRSNPDGPNTDGENLTEPKDGMFIGIMVVAGVVGIAFSLFWLRVMQRNSTRIIQISLCACITLAVVGFIVALVSSNPWMAAWFIISGFCIGLYYYFVRSRIPFASAILESSVTAICENNGPILVVYGLSILNLAWLAFWAFVFASVLHAGDKVTTIQNPDGSITQYRASQTSGLQFLQFLCVVSLYWTCQTIKNIGHVTTAGTVASWWFQPSLRQPTRGAFIRACTTSLGSIIFGSLLVAIVQTIRAMLRSAQRDSCREIVDCLLSYMENALKWFNRYTFSTIAIYGLPFVEAAKRTGEMLSSQLFTAVINDDLSGMVLFCGNFLAASCSGVIALIWAFQADAPSYQVYGVLAFIVGYLVSSLAMSVIQSSVTTTFVCWACDPATLEHNRPNEFRRIVDAAHNKYGTIMQQHEQQYQQEQHYAQQPQTYHLPQQ